MHKLNESEVGYVINIIIFFIAVSIFLFFINDLKTHEKTVNTPKVTDTEPDYVELYESQPKIVSIPVPVKEKDTFVFATTGEYLPMKTWILDHMSFPDSYKHISTTIKSTEKSHIVTCTINGHTLSNEDVNQTVTVEFGLNGEFIQYIP